MADWLDQFSTIVAPGTATLDPASGILEDDWLNASSEILETPSALDSIIPPPIVNPKFADWTPGPIHAELPVLPSEYTDPVRHYEEALPEREKTYLDSHRRFDDLSAQLRESGGWETRYEDDSDLTRSWKEAGRERELAEVRMEASQEEYEKAIARMLNREAYEQEADRRAAGIRELNPEAATYTWDDNLSEEENAANMAAALEAGLGDTTTTGERALQTAFLPTRAIFSGGLKFLDKTTQLIQRVFGDGKDAAYRDRVANRWELTNQRLDDKTLLNPYAAYSLRVGGETLTEAAMLTGVSAATGGAASPLALIIAFHSTTGAENAYGQAKAAGKSDEEAMAYAGGVGAITGALTWAGGRFFGPTLEEGFNSMVRGVTPGIIQRSVGGTMGRSGLSGALGRVALGSTGEVTEEVAQELGEALLADAMGVEDWETEQIKERIKRVIGPAAVGGTVGGVMAGAAPEVDAGVEPVAEAEAEPVLSPSPAEAAVDEVIAAAEKARGFLKDELRGRADGAAYAESLETIPLRALPQNSKGFTAKTGKRGNQAYREAFGDEVERAAYERLSPQQVYEQVGKLGDRKMQRAIAALLKKNPARAMDLLKQVAERYGQKVEAGEKFDKAAVLKELLADVQEEYNAKMRGEKTQREIDRANRAFTESADSSADQQRTAGQDFSELRQRIYNATAGETSAETRRRMMDVARYDTTLANDIMEDAEGRWASAEDENSTYRAAYDYAAEALVGQGASQARLAQLFKRIDRNGGDADSIRRFDEVAQEVAYAFPGAVDPKNAFDSLDAFLRGGRQKYNTPPVNQYVDNGLEQAEQIIRDRRQRRSGKAVTPAKEIVEGAIKVGQGLRYGWNKYLRAQGLAPESMRQAYRASHNEQNAILKDLETGVSRFNQAVREEYGGARNIDAPTVQAMDSFLKGGQADLKPKTRTALAWMRGHIDNLSRRLIDAGVPEGLELTIDQNLGVYVTRTYRKHEESNWVERAKADPELMGRWREWAKEQWPEISEGHLDWLTNMMLSRHAPTEKEIAGLPPYLKKSTKFMSVLRERRDIPEVIRDLYGEYKDPWVNYTTSITKLAQLVTQKELVNNIKGLGLATGIFVEPSDLSADIDPEKSHRINVTGNPLLEPLNGLFTDKQTATAIQEMFSPELHSGIYRVAVTLSGAAKWSATPGSVKATLRNFWGNIEFAMRSGTLGQGGFWNAAHSTAQDYLRRGDKATRQRIRRYAALGVIGSDVQVNELMDQARVMSSYKVSPLENPKFFQTGPGKVIREVSRFYQAMDTFWKIQGFEGMRKTYRKAFPDMKDDALDAYTAERMLSIYPNYESVGKGVKAVSRFGVFGNFLSFRAETIRTGINHAKLAMEELRSDNPVLRRAGATKLVGGIAAMSSLPTIAALSAAILGITEDEQEELRDFLPPWSANSPLLWLGGPTGERNAVDLGFTDPNSWFTKMLVSMGRDRPTYENLTDAAAEGLDPLREGILFGKVTDVLRNEKAEGGSVYNESDTAYERGKAIGKHVGQVMIPRTFVDAYRVFTGDDPRLEAVSFTGFRPMTIDVAKSYGFRAREQAELVDGAEAGIRKVLRDEDADPQDVYDTYMRLAAQREKFLEDWSQLTANALRNSTDTASIQADLSSAAGQRDAGEILSSGPYGPYLPSLPVLRAVSASPGGDARLEMLYKAQGDWSNRER